MGKGFFSPEKAILPCRPQRHFKELLSQLYRMEQPWALSSMQSDLPHTGSPSSPTGQLPTPYKVPAPKPQALLLGEPRLRVTHVQI